MPEVHGKLLGQMRTENLLPLKTDSVMKEEQLPGNQDPAVLCTPRSNSDLARNLTWYLTRYSSLGCLL